MRNRIGGADWSLGSTPNKICFTCCSNTTDTIDNIYVLPTVGPALGSCVRCGVSVGEWGCGNGGLVGGRHLSVEMAYFSRAYSALLSSRSEQPHDRAMVENPAAKALPNRYIDRTAYRDCHDFRRMADSDNGVPNTLSAQTSCAGSS